MRFVRTASRRRLGCHIVIAATLLSVMWECQPLIGADAATEQSELVQAYTDLFTKPDSVRASEREYLPLQTQCSCNGALVTTLRLAYSEHLIPADPPAKLFKPQKLRLRCYNGCMVGPTLRIRPGDRLDITVKNALPPNEPLGNCMSGPEDTPHGFNCTNLHTHGLHVSPLEDNVFLQIGPHEQYTYEYHIRPDHVAGTFWYHPH